MPGINEDADETYAAGDLGDRSQEEERDELVDYIERVGIEEPEAPQMDQDPNGYNAEYVWD